MSGWWEVALALVLFLVSHGLPVQPPVRTWLIRHLGRGVYLALYSTLSLVLLVWLVAAVGRAPYVELWAPAPWQRWVPFLAMPLACLLLALGLGARNPLSLGGRSEGFDPARPGLAGITRHPLLWALALWAAAHALANGDLAHVALFGAFALFSLLAGRAIDRRRQSALGPSKWRALAASAPFLPFGRLGQTRLAGWSAASLAVRLPAAALLFLALLHLHLPVIGVSPLPAEMLHG